MKPWRARLERHVSDWSQRLPSACDWWPRFAYHFTNVANAVKILQHGQVLSRNAAVAAGLMQTDNASRSVIRNTAPAHLNYARFYFRPRTPTQWNSEGFRPRYARGLLDAHCAMPVFFFFDFVGVMAEDTAEFSDGNIASSSVVIRSDEPSFDALKFEDIYSEGGMGGRKRELTFARNAEILIPNALPLHPHLKMIFCRSLAERATFLHMLQEIDPALRTKYEPYILWGTAPIFERRATFVETVTATHDQVQFAFNPATQFPGPFEVEFEFSTIDAGPWTFRGQQTLGAQQSYSLQGVAGRTGVASLRLDGECAFRAAVSFVSAPF